MASGITGTKLFEAMCDEVVAETSRPAEPDIDTKPVPTGGTCLESLVRSTIEFLSPVRQLRLVSAALAIPRRLTAAGIGVATVLTHLLSEMLTSSTDTSLIGPSRGAVAALAPDRC